MDKTTWKYRFAVATSDGIMVNQHFGRASRFQIYGMRENDTADLLEDRYVTPICEVGDHDDTRLRELIETLSDCKFVLVSRIGRGAASELEKKKITPLEAPDMIQESIRKLGVYVRLMNLFP